MVFTGKKIESLLYDYMYPITLDLKKKPVLIIGAGNVGERKIRSVCDAGAVVTVISEIFGDNAAILAEEYNINVIKRSYKYGDCRDFFLVIASTDDRETNQKIYQECMDLGIFVNIVDKPEFCSFHVPAVVRRGDLSIAISTSGKSPALAREIRKKLEEFIDVDYVGLVRELGEIRDKIKAEYEGDSGKISEEIDKAFWEIYNQFNKNKGSVK